MFHRRSLSRFATSDRGRRSQANTYVYSTADDAATLQSVGYFDNARATLKKGDLITCAVQVEGAPTKLELSVVDVPLIGNVTVALGAGGGGVTPISELLQKGIDLLSFDFRTTGPRSTPAKVPGVDTLPTGATLDTTNKLVRVPAASTVAFDGWDFSANGGWQLFLSVAGAIVSLTDSKIGPKGISQSAANALTIDYCDFDGGKDGAGQNPILKQSAGSLIVRRNRFHGTAEDCINTASNVLVENNYFYDSGYKTDGHVDFIQAFTGVVLSSMTFRRNLFDGTLVAGQVADINNCIRMVAQSGGSLDGVVIEDNIFVSQNTMQPPLAIGNRGDTTPSGAGVTNVTVQRNFFRMATASAVYGLYDVTGGSNYWIGNKNLDTLAAITGPASYATSASSNRRMFAATRLRFPTVTGTFPASGNYQIANFFFGSPAYDVTEPQFFLPTFSQITTGASTSEIAAPNAVNFEGLSIKVGGVWYACPTAAFVMDPATEASGYLLDAIPGVTIPANSFIEGRIAFNGATGAVAIGVSRANLIGEVAGGSTTSLAAKLTDGTAIVQSNAVARQFIPAFMVAKGGDGRPVFLLAGDSIEAGANENGASFGLLSPRANVGYWQRTLDDNVGSKRIAYGTLALEGSRPGDWSTRANWAKKLDAVKKVTTLNGGFTPFTHVGSNHGNNSINATDLYATNVAFWQVCKAEWPGIPIHHSELLTRPTSTDGFQTLANQAPAQVDTYPTGQRWVFNEKVGKGALTGDPTAQARVDGWIAGSFAPWRVASYDLTTNRDKLSIIPGVLTFTAAVASGATVLPVSDASGLQVGDMIGINYTAASTASFDTTILSISGNNVTVSSGATQAFAAGTPVNPMWNDRSGLHPGTRHHMRIAAEAGIPWKVANGWGLAA